MAYNKIIYGNKTLIDLTSDTVTADKMLTGATAHAADGTVITGTCAYDVNSTDATVKVAEMLSGKTAYARGSKLTGSMPNNGAVNLTITDLDDSIAIAQGYHDGSGKVAIAKTEKDKILAENIKNGVVILGVTGTLSPASDVTASAVTVTPKTTAQTILPETGKDYISQVNVAAIAYSESANSAGGTTVTIAG